MTNKLSLPTEKITWSISDLVKLNEQSKLVINKEYQRSEVWKLPKKQLLIDSILSDYDIGSVILRQKDDKWEILDGQQRLKAILDFIENEFSLPNNSENAGKFWKELGPEIQWGQFMNRKVYVTKIYSVDDETTSIIFLRVQEGMPLTGAEKLNAMRGLFRNKVFELSQHPFFYQTGVNEFRFAYRYLVAQMATQELEDGVNHHTFKDAKSQKLKEIYLKYKDRLPPRIFERVNLTLNFLQNYLGTSAQTIEKKSDFLTIYLLTSYIIQRFAIKNREQKFRDFIVDFLHKVETDSTNEGDYYNYWVARSSSPDSKGQIESRFEIILRKFLEFDTTIEQKDSQRNFGWGQRLTIYKMAYKKARQNGRDEAECEICHNPTPLEDGSADHIKPYNLGGKTIIENGQWTCISCNSSKQDRIDD